MSGHIHSRAPLPDESQERGSVAFLGAFARDAESTERIQCGRDESRWKVPDHGKALDQLIQLA